MYCIHVHFIEYCMLLTTGVYFNIDESSRMFGSCAGDELATRNTYLIELVKSNIKKLGYDYAFLCTQCTFPDYLVYFNVLCEDNPLTQTVLKLNDTENTLIMNITFYQVALKARKLTV